MNVCIIGAGVVGTAFSAALRARGMRSSFYDPAKRFDDRSDLARCDVAFVCVPTPYNERGHDLSIVREAISGIPGDKAVVVRSTVLPGTTDALQAEFPQHRLMFAPEFLTERTAFEDAAHPARTIVGYTDRSRLDADRVLSVMPRAPFMRTMRAKDAEMVKYFANTFYALKVAFSNQVYDLCQAVGVDYAAVREAGLADPMMGPNHTDVFHAGYRGYGGKCLPKDMRALLSLAREEGVDLGVLQAAEDYNNALTGETPWPSPPPSPSSE